VTITGNFLMGVDPTISKRRNVCPSYLRDKSQYVSYGGCFGIAGRRDTKKDDDNDNITELELVTKSDDTTGDEYNPFNCFIKESFLLLETLFLELEALTQEHGLDKEDLRERFDFPPDQLPRLPLTIDTLLQFGDLQYTLGYIKQYITCIRRFSTNIDTKNVEEAYIETRKSFEGTEMHLFLGMWNLWDRPEEPYIVNLLSRAETVSQFHLLLTEEYLGTFYMVRWFVFSCHRQQ